MIYLKYPLGWFFLCYSLFSLISHANATVKISEPFETVLSKVDKMQNKIEMLESNEKELRSSLIEANTKLLSLDMMKQKISNLEITNTELKKAIFELNDTACTEIEWKKREILDDSKRGKF